MPVKSIIEIDVNDAAFVNFIKAFDKYKASVKDMPKDWDKSNEALDALAETLETATGELEKQRDLMEGADKAAERAAAKRKKEADDARKRQRQQLKDATEASANVAKMLVGGAAKFAEILGIGGIAGGLLGLGGLFGFDRLAERFGDARKQSMGLGVNPGQLQAAKINFQPYLADSASTLDKIAEAKMDPVGQTYLKRMGLDPNQSAADLLPQILQKSRQLYERGVRAPQLIEASGVGRFIDRQEFMTLGSEKASNFNEAIKSYKADANNGIGDETYRGFQQFSIQMHRAGQDIENVLGKNLVGLADPLTKLSQTVVGVIDDLSKSGVFKELINDLGDGIKSFAAELKTPEFRKGLQEFIADIPLVAKGIHDLLVFLRVIPGTPGQSTGTPITGVAGMKYEDHAMGFGSEIALLSKGVNATVKAAADAFHVPANLLDNIFGAESSHGKNAHASSKGALGNFQLMPATARQYGVNPLDPQQAAMGAAHFLADLLKKYHGDAVAASAAYNWGPGNVDKAMRRYGAGYLAHAPKETRNYVARTVPQVNVKINDTTGGQVNASANLGANLFPFGVSLNK